MELHSGTTAIDTAVTAMSMADCPMRQERTSSGHHLQLGSGDVCGGFCLPSGAVSIWGVGRHCCRLVGRRAAACRPWDLEGTGQAGCDGCMHVCWGQALQPRLVLSRLVLSRVVGIGK